ncbi:MAG: Fic family protein [Candidatus Daviesbacteria bacterium]|nr:Fic family protein [Candidatus Daviesbacteria bacterium]
MIDNSEIFLPATEVIPPPLTKQIAHCIECARRHVVKIIQHKKIGGEKKGLGPGILQSLHREVLDYYPGWAGKFRVSDDVRVGDRKPVLTKDLEDHVYKFETWLEEEIKNLEKPENHEDLYGALRVASAAHYAVVGDLHPFDDGNGRVARVLMNGILMLNTNEGRFYNYYIFPVPLLRETIKEEEIQKILDSGKEPKMSLYLKALTEVNNTWTLNPFEVYIAGKWIESINQFLGSLEHYYKKSPKDKHWKSYLNIAATKYVDKLMERRSRLTSFIEDNRKGKYPIDKVPDFYASKYIVPEKS